MTAEPLRAVELLRDEHEVEGFNCGRVELYNWLARTAQVAASAGTAATYVLCRGRKVVGYYALAMGSVAHSTAPSRLRHGMPDWGSPCRSDTRPYAAFVYVSTFSSNSSGVT